MNKEPDKYFEESNNNNNSRSTKSQARAERRAQKSAKVGHAGGPITAKSANQHSYISKLLRNESVFGVGPAGVGKTYLPARIAARKLMEGKISKIVITRVTVSAPKHALGFLPGKLEQKLAPWLIPVFDGLKAEVSAVTLDKWRAEGKVELCAFEHLRGRTFRDCVVILDEAQNASLADLKLLLTRIGENCQVVVTGDLDQIDVRDSGLLEVVQIAETHDVPMSVVRFHENDVVRSEFTKAWVSAFRAESEGILDHNPAFLHNARTVTKLNE